jgi:phosphoribosylaminoimidazole-succinocarboxamide synthase
MGSVKDLICDDSPAGKLHQSPTFDRLGLGAWRVSGRFSVADLKGRIPPQEIPHKGAILAMAAGRYWEHAAQAGFQSTYVGMLDADGQIVSAETLLDRGELSDRIAMRLAVTPHDFYAKITTDNLAAYHARIAGGHIGAYVADAECIFRFGFPLGSTTFKRIYTAAGMADNYEQRATYDETVAGLDEIRDIPGIMEKPEMVKVLREAGLNCIPNPGHLMTRPVVHFNTKFDPGGDKDITYAEAQQAMHLDNLRFAAWLATLENNARHQREHCEAAGIVNIDGKTEAVIVNGFPVFTDFACTPDENRTMIRYVPASGSPVYLLPTNKEVQRAGFRHHGIYAAKDAAQRDHGDAWLDHLDQYVNDSVIEEATQESVWMMEQALATVGNRLLGRNVLEAKPIEEWVGPFLPYASIEQTAS